MSSQGWYESLVSSQADGAAITAAAETSCIPPAAVITLPVGYFKNLGQKIIVRATGLISSVNPTPGTARFKVKLGATIAFDGLAILLDPVAARTNVGWMLNIELTVRVIGSSASLIGSGSWICENISGVTATPPKSAAVAILPWNSAPAAGATFNSAATQALDLTFTQTAATGSLTCQTYEVVACN